MNAYSKKTEKENLIPQETLNGEGGKKKRNQLMMHQWMYSGAQWKLMPMQYKRIFFF